MKKILDVLWDEFFAEKCASLDTAEERQLTAKAAEHYKKVNELLNKEQKVAVEKYVETLWDIEALFVKKAFLKGCEFGVNFILELNK